jgi:hypothetical protein
MVIFHSYVSLPEGRNHELHIKYSTLKEMNNKSFALPCLVTELRFLNGEGSKLIPYLFDWGDEHP